MAPAPVATVPRPTPVIAPPGPPPVLSGPLRRWLAHELRTLRPHLAASAAACQADRYRKHFTAVQHGCLLLFHGLAGSASLRRTYAAFPQAPGLVAASGLAVRATTTGPRLTLSFSQLAASTTSRPAAFLAGLVPDLAARVQAHGGRPGAQLPPDLRVLDSTFLRLCGRLCRWLPGVGGHDVPGVRVQVQYAPAFDLPEHLLVTDTRTNDCQGLDAAILDDPARLAALRDLTLVVDLGYYSHARFARLRAARVHFVTRLQGQATVRVEATLPVQAPLPGLVGGRITVASDQRITLGSANNRAGAVLRGVRLVTATVAPGARAARRGAPPITYRVVTDRWDLSAAEVVQCYLWRWEIELFFRWLKRQIGLPRWLGHSPNAVELTIWLAIIVHLLLVLAAWALGRARRTPALLDEVRWTLAHLTLDEDATPLAVAQLALPGWAPSPPVPT